MQGTVITNKGLQLIAKLVASGTALSFTRAAVGIGSVPSGYDPTNMTGLNKYKMNGAIASCGSSGDTASIVFQISSIGVSTGFTITEAGLFATDPDEGEILYCYLDMSSDPQYIYAEGSAISKFVEMTLTVVIGSVQSVTAYINPGSLLTNDGDISNTKVSSFTSTTASYPIPAANDTVKVGFGKIKKFFEDIRNAATGACFIGNIVNNCVTNNAKLPLSAAQGKALMDLYTQLNSDLGDCYKLKNKRLIPSGADLNNYRTPGTYLVNSADLSTIKNKPTGWTTTGGIITIEDWIDPAVVTMTIKTYNGYIYWRNYLSGTWTEWVSGTVTTDLSSINPSNLILQSRASGYPKPTFFADSAGALFMRCYLNATDYYELSLNSVGAYVNKCIGGKIVFTNKFVTF